MYYVDSPNFLHNVQFVNLVTRVILRPTMTKSLTKSPYKSTSMNFTERDWKSFKDFPIKLIFVFNVIDLNHQAEETTIIS